MELKDLTGGSGLSPDEVLRLFRSVVTRQDVTSLARMVLDLAIEEQNPQAWTFVQKILFPDDKSAVEDTRWKRVVFCTFQEYNEVVQLKARIAELEAENKELRGEA